MGVDIEIHLLNSKKYSEEPLPAYKRFFERGETQPLATLLDKVIGELPSKDGQLELVGPKEIYENDRDILEGRVFYAPGVDIVKSTKSLKTDQEHLKDFVKSNIGPSIAYVLCSEVRPGVPTSVNMTRTQRLIFTSILNGYSKHSSSSVALMVPFSMYQSGNQLNF